MGIKKILKNNGLDKLIDGNWINNGRKEYFEQ